MSRPLHVGLALVLASAGLPIAAAAYCDPTATVTPLGADFGYLVRDNAAPGYVLSTWIYQESNGEVGLQRGGAAFLNGTEDICQASDMPDTLLSGVALLLGEPPASAPYPGVLFLVDGSLLGPTFHNPLGWDCSAFTPDAAGGSVTCSPPALVPPGFEAGCSAPRVWGAFATLTPGTGEIASRTDCGSASASCTTNVPSSTGNLCQAADPNAGALPVTCSASLLPASYFVWWTLCMWSG